VFRGEEVFEFWKHSIGRAITCADIPNPYTDTPRIDRTCAFSRSTTISKQTSIEYCTVAEDIQSGIRETPICMTVAAEKAAVHKVLSSRYTYYDASGGEFAGEFRCTIPGANSDDVVTNVEEFIKRYVGPSSKYSAKSGDSGEIEFRAQGIDIEDGFERMFLRVYLTGSFYRSDDAKSQHGVEVIVNAYFTVSAQSSDNLIDYREPNDAMTNRLRNRFEGQIRVLLKTLPQKSSCKFD
jgi:hypothetical protein